MGLPRSRPWAAAAIAVLFALLALDLATGPDVIVIALYGIAPLVASFGTGWRTTAAVAVAALLLAVISRELLDEMDTANGVMFVFTVAVLGVLACGGAVARTRREASAARARLLSEVGDLLATAEDPAATLPAVAAAAVPAVADRCTIDLTAPHGGPERAAAMPGTPPPAVEQALARVARGAPPEVSGSELVVPLAARDGRLGALELGMNGSRRSFGSEDRALAEEVARRCAAALDGARLVAEAQAAEGEAELAVREQTARYESLLLALSDVGEAMLVLDVEGRLEYANPAFEAICGYTTEELRALPSVFDLVVEEQRVAARRHAQARLEGAAEPGRRITIRHRDGHRVPMEIAGVPLEVGERPRIVVVGRDITARARAAGERERLLHRTAFLAEASAAFDAVLDEVATLNALARLSVRELADTCVILLGGSAAGIRRVATVARDPADERRLEEIVKRYPFADRRSHPLLEVLATGRARVVEHPDGPGVPIEDDAHRELIARFATQSTLLVPLTARGRTLGVMALGFNSPAAREHLSLFEDVARRAALAIDNARLYEERANVARTLQRSLLPPVLPDVPGVQLAARYLAAGEGEVGGDFYDCFPTSGGDWALVIGDVCGKGAEAAAVTALARYTVRASATLHSDRPEVVLQDLNDAIRREGKAASRFCTVLYIALRPTPDGVSACVATGGHPLPLLMRADGRVETAGRPGTLLGILPDPEIRSTEVDLAAGDTLVLYTDGVTEASPLDDRFGPEQLARFVAGCSGREAPVIARRIEEQVLEVGGGSIRDDVAVVVLRVRPTRTAPFVADEPGVAASR